MIRLFTTDDGPLSECATPEGQQAAMKVQFTISDLVKWASNSGYSLRDFEILLLSRVQMEIAKEILVRRRFDEPCTALGCNGNIVRDKLPNVSAFCNRCYRTFP